MPTKPRGQKMIDMPAAVRALTQIRAAIPENYRAPDPDIPPNKVDVDAALQLLAQIRASIPEKYRVPVPPRPEAAHAFMASPLPSAGELELFDLETVQEGVETVLAELTASLDYARNKAIEESLKIYYVAEELAKDPEHADLIPHVIAMREAYERDFGEPIPPRPKPE
jgi:hypothetical protein